MRLLHILGFASLFAASLSAGSAGCVVKEKELCSGAFEPDNQACSLQYCEQHRSDETCIEFLNKLDAGFAPDVEGKPDGATGDSPDAAGDEPDGSVGGTCDSNQRCPETAPLCLDGSCHKCTSGDSCAFRAETPVCDLETGACVACTESSPGTCAEQDLVCVVAAAEAEPEAKPNTCVACNTAGDCTKAAESACNAQHTCEPCSDSEQHCKHLTGLPICLDGNCVACQPGQLGVCGGKVCDVVSGAQPVCSNKAPHSANVCEACVSDEHCAQGQACVNMKWENVSVGWFCQWKKNTEDGSPIHACNSNDRPYTRQLTFAASADSSASVTVCTLAAATCEALRAYNGHCGRFGEGESAVFVEDRFDAKLPANTPAAEIHADPSVCGAGGICRPRTGAGNTDPEGAYRCSFECIASSPNDHTDCPNQSGVTCQTPALGGAGYCSVL